MMLMSIDSSSFGCFLNYGVMDSFKKLSYKDCKRLASKLALDVSDVCSLFGVDPPLTVSDEDLNEDLSREVFLRGLPHSLEDVKGQDSLLILSFLRDNLDLAIRKDDVDLALKVFHHRYADVSLQHDALSFLLSFASRTENSSLLDVLRNDGVVVSRSDFFSRVISVLIDFQLSLLEKAQKKNDLDLMIRIFNDTKDDPNPFFSVVASSAKKAIFHLSFARFRSLRSAEHPVNPLFELFFLLPPSFFMLRRAILQYILLQGKMLHDPFICSDLITSFQRLSLPILLDSAYRCFFKSLRSFLERNEEYLCENPSLVRHLILITPSADRKREVLLFFFDCCLKS